MTKIDVLFRIRHVILNQNVKMLRAVLENSGGVHSGLTTLAQSVSRMLGMYGM
jgi:hypothetical protein